MTLAQHTDEKLLTPDFNVYDLKVLPVKIENHSEQLQVHWDNATISNYDAIWLLDNSTAKDHLHSKTREQLLDISLVSDDLHIVDATIDKNRFIEIEWSHNFGKSIYHPGWLIRHDYSNPKNSSEIKYNKILWDRSSLKEPPTFDGHDILQNDTVLFQWLESIAIYGLARLRNTPTYNNFVDELGQRVGTVRESNFGRVFDVKVQLKPDSNAYTSEELKPHVDLATREYMPGLQYLHCLKNSTIGGEAGMVDGFRIAEYVKKERPDFFEVLSHTKYILTNRAEDTDYQWKSPAFVHDYDGELLEIRIANFLRGPMYCEASKMKLTYQALQYVLKLVQNPEFQINYAYEVGDCVCFDNRRLLHARKAFNTQNGERHLQGIYQEREELYSKIRILMRKFKKQ